MRPYLPPFAFALATLPALLGSASAWTAATMGEDPPVSFTGDIQPIVANYCATCHHGADPDGGFVLDTYEDVRSLTEKGDLLERIHDADDPMPPAGLMSRRQRALFRTWADGGYLNQGDRVSAPSYAPFTPPKLTPLAADEHGVKFLKALQGHWVGSMNLMGQELDWFAWDFRAIAPSHVHGIFEGGTLGNLFTSFFIADFHGQPTVMARNGGLLNGIYRTSYFVLTEAESSGATTTYRFVDARGGAAIMWMDLEFTGSSLDFTAYTSRLGMAGAPKRHMHFQGDLMHPELARAAAKAVGFPKLTNERTYPNGLPLPDWGKNVPITSYSYIWEDKDLSVEELGVISGDPIRIDQMPHLSRLRVSFERTPALAKTKMEVYLSRAPLTDAKGKLLMEFGYVRKDLYDGLLQFPELGAGEEEFTFTYLHPGTYYVTVAADLNGDGYASKGDVLQASREIVVEPKERASVHVEGPWVQN